MIWRRCASVRNRSFGCAKASLRRGRPRNYCGASMSKHGWALAKRGLGPAASDPGCLMNVFVEILNPNFLLWNSVAISALVGLVCPLVGVYLVLRRVVFL